MQPKALCEKMGVGPQLEPEQMTELAKAGYKAVINCRPDNEEPGQPTSQQLEEAARAAGLAYAHVPVVPGQMGDEQVTRFNAALSELPQPVFGFCKSGMRASSLWAVCRASDLGADEVIERAGGAGYDLSALKSRLG
ncbi:TIGR01244 family sulfur transferase [Aurantiacibacter poecillastricola]|uniref:TIGR01244 family sulfur transferase n=1 Tax=Aurantiacibacter poecillastricola TaxID=3064385 RepID=UPI00273E4599|nr:TIGR01244 family sulfur transferase [Aurantiacibacter sp. 219JJ12-13]MDP5261121.1 TIGR01244 family sulfur transferase [Aurantiacibacter sp. 219JJ12-13]